MTFRTGYVALIGRPNAGKSTLLNRILGAKLAITSAKPQTTRDRILGVHTDALRQIIFVDTPGLHEPSKELNRRMVEVAHETIGDVDVVCWLIDTRAAGHALRAGRRVLCRGDEAIAELLTAAGKPVILVPNKVDIEGPSTSLPIIEGCGTLTPLVASVPLSALTGDGLEALLGEITAQLPEQPALYPQEHWTDASERFLVSEIIREKLFALTHQEVPYASCIEIDRFDESQRESNGRVRILARINVERNSQKGIVIGKGGSMLKKIGTQARIEIQELLDCKVHLELFVTVEKDWSQTARGLRRVGFKGTGA